MFLFSSKRKEHELQSLMLKYINNQCSGLRAALDDPRFESRVAINVVALLIPTHDGQPALREAFAAVTKDFSTKGCSVILSEPSPLDEAIIALRWEGSMQFLRAKAVHLDPMGGGFFQVGFEFSEIVRPADCPVLESVYF